MGSALSLTIPWRKHIERIHTEVTTEMARIMRTGCMHARMAQCRTHIVVPSVTSSRCLVSVIVTLISRCSRQRGAASDETEIGHTHPSS